MALSVGLLGLESESGVCLVQVAVGVGRRVLEMARVVIELMNTDWL